MVIHSNLPVIKIYAKSLHARVIEPMVSSLTNGVPVFCDPNNSAAAPISETDLSKIETPKYGDRIALFSSLAYNNWTLQEMANGTAWRMLNES